MTTEPADIKLTPKQERFCVEYVKDCNGRRAAIAAGYAESSAHVQASQNLIKPNIASRIEVLAAQRTQRTELNREMVLSRLIMEAHDENNPGAVRVQALTQLGRHLGLFTDKLDITTNLREIALSEAREVGLPDAEAIAIAEEIDRELKAGKL